MRILVVLVLLSASLLNCKYSSPTLDCNTLKGQELLLDFEVKFMDMSHDPLTEQDSNDSRNSGVHLNIRSKQIGDTLLVTFYKNGGNSNLDCVELEVNQEKINITNYESNHLKEITFKQFEYRILNRDRLELGTINSRVVKNN